VKVLAIDPGNTQSAFVVFDGKNIIDKGKVNNDDLLSFSGKYDHVAIEMIASYGMGVGQTVFDTCLWVGRFIERFAVTKNIKYTLVYRKDVKMFICHSMRAKDANIRQAVIDIFPPTGGGKIPQIGTKGKPGPLYGVSADIWAALGVAITWFNKHNIGGGLICR
jgi:hypothetical protein